MQTPALKAELLKNRSATILWGTFVAFGLAPLMGGVFMLIMRNPQALAKAGSLNAKAQMMNFTADWLSYFGILTQAVGVGGVMVFGFVASCIFGREYSDGTAKDLLALPTSRTGILNAKFIVYTLWCFALAVFNLLLGFIIGTLLGLAPLPANVLGDLFATYFITTLLTILLGFPIAFFAIWGRGYLAPLAFVALTLVFAQIVAATGYGYYFPWAIPGLFSGTAGEYKAQLNVVSYAILLSTSLTGYIATQAYWRYTDQSK